MTFSEVTLCLDLYRVTLPLKHRSLTREFESSYNLHSFLSSLKIGITVLHLNLFGELLDLKIALNSFVSHLIPFSFSLQTTSVVYYVIQLPYHLPSSLKLLLPLYLLIFQ